MESFINLIIGVSLFPNGGLDFELFGLDFNLFWVWRPSFLVGLTCLLALLDAFYLNFASLPHVNPLSGITRILSLPHANVVHLFRRSSLRNSLSTTGCRSVPPLHLSHRMSF